MNKNLFNQIIKFSIVGGLAFIIDYGILFLLSDVFNINYLISSIISFSVSVIFNYILSTQWIFLSSKNASKKTFEFFIFITLSIVGLLVNSFIMWFFVEIINIHYLITKVIATLIVMIYNFISRKIFLEKHN